MFHVPLLPVRSYLPGSTCALLEKKEFCLMRTESRLKVSRAHAANYRDGPMYNGSVGVVCHHIQYEKGGSSEPPRTPAPPAYAPGCEIDLSRVVPPYTCKLELL